MRRGFQLLASAFVLSLGLSVTHAGGEFKLSSPEAKQTVDLTKTVLAHCSSTAEDGSQGVVLQVRYPESLRNIASDALREMKAVRTILSTDLRVKIPVGARIYLVDLESYPESFRIHDHGRDIAFFVILQRGWTGEQKAAATISAVHKTLVHEWAHGLFDSTYPSRSAASKSAWVTEGYSAYLEYMVSMKLSNEDSYDLRAKYLPELSLDEVGAENLATWRLPADSVDELKVEMTLRHYGAALGLFLRIAELGGPDVVPSLIGQLASRKSVTIQDLSHITQKLVGSSLRDLGTLSDAQRQLLYDQAKSGLSDKSRAVIAYGISTLRRYPARFQEHRTALEGILFDREKPEMLRALAAKCIAEQADTGLLLALTTRLDQENTILSSPWTVLPIVSLLAERKSPCGLAVLLRIAQEQGGAARSRALRELGLILGHGKSIRDLETEIGSLVPEDACRDLFSKVL